jgi:hypothetical protein
MFIVTLRKDGVRFQVKGIEEIGQYEDFQLRVETAYLTASPGGACTDKFKPRLFKAKYWEAMSVVEFTNDSQPVEFAHITIWPIFHQLYWVHRFARNNFLVTASNRRLPYDGSCYGSQYWRGNMSA